MTRWELLDAAKVPDHGGELKLYRRGEEFSIRADGLELMSSRVHGSEVKLAEFGCDRIDGVVAARVLIGGLGLGFTLGAALKRLGPGAEVTVAELVPAVVRWNRGPLAGLAGRPLDDPRVRVVEEDVLLHIEGLRAAYDAVLLDVDNGPEGLTRRANDRLYSPGGIAAAAAVLRPHGVVAYWSAKTDWTFTRRLFRAGFDVEEVVARASGHRGAHHTIWLATPGKRRRASPPRRGRGRKW